MISFEQTAKQKNISDKEVHHEFFKGLNLSDKVIKVVKHSTTCSCTAGKIPEEIQPNELFMVEMIVNKVGVTGYFSTSLKLTFSTGQEITLNLNGEVK